MTTITIGGREYQFGSDSASRSALADLLAEQYPDLASLPDLIRPLASQPAPADWREHVIVLEPTETERAWGDEPVVSFSPELAAALWAIRRIGNCNVFHCGPEARNHLHSYQADRPYTVDGWRAEVAGWCFSHARGDGLPADALAAHRDCCTYLGMVDAAAEIGAMIPAAVVRDAAKADAALEPARAKTRLQAAHRAAIADKVARLQAASRAAYAQRKVSQGYWSARRAALIAAHPGIIDAIVVDSIRGTPPAGVIWVRPSSGGRWGKSRRVKVGRALTIGEINASNHRGKPRPTGRGE